MNLTMIGGEDPYLFKDAAGAYTVRIASATAAASADDAVGALCRAHSFEGKTFNVARGDYAALMARVVAGISDAIPAAANEQQTKMLEHYAKSFNLGATTSTSVWSVFRAFLGPMPPSERTV